MSVSVRGGKFQLSKNKHMCGADTINKRDVTMGSGGINGNWNGPTKVDT